MAVDGSVACITNGRARRFPNRGRRYGRHHRPRSRSSPRASDVIPRRPLGLAPVIARINVRLRPPRRPPTEVPPMPSDRLDPVAHIHRLARRAREAREARYSWTGSEEHTYYLDGRYSALEVAASSLAWDYAHSDECDWHPLGHPDREEADDE